MKSGCRLILSILLFCMAVGTVPGSEDHSFFLPDAKTMTRLRAGELLLENDRSEENGASASVLAFIHAPVERIWAIIISCGYAHAFVAGLQLCEVLQEHGDYAVTRQVVDKGWTVPTLDFTFETRREAYRHMDFRLMRGNLKTMHGTWDFRSFPDGVLVRHALVIKPALPAPRWLVRRNLRKDLPNMLRCIRGLSDGGGSAQATRADRLRCPGKVQGR